MTKIESARQAIEDRVFRRRLRREHARRQRQTQRYLRSQERAGLWPRDTGHPVNGSSADALER